ncbi:hypothetical protein AJ80_04989 [Polytolypa hystricis UAMH7299]|uniref:BZIP domain-containing protein n=1 Tax=Polytolypa hystricis (strain UAMH7299) TaxID=1447883 RepID=A0A2B7Y785_POLH7|nr:hypothetical protein AJ80_04989 [Polytolypa hystricis UAMH7299]
MAAHRNDMSSAQTADYGLSFISTSYPEIPSIVTHVPESNKTSPRLLYGGVSVCHNADNSYYENRSVRHSMTPPSENKKGSTRRKTKSTSGNGTGSEDETSKKRGRPRLDTQDETAAERRRTQIRLAQRAYRLRKEATISSLNQRVAELEETVEEMSRSFLAFNDEAMNSGLLSSQPELAEQLRRATERFLSLAKDGHPELDRSDNALNLLDSRNSTPDAYHTGQVRSRAGSHYSGGVSDGHSSYDIPNALHEAGPYGRNAGFQEQSQLYLPNVSAPGSYEIGQNQNWMFVDPSPQVSMSLTHAESPNFSLFSQVSRPLSSPYRYTYNFQEATFARRLHRACLQRGLDLLTNPSTDPSKIKHTFRFSLGFATKERIRRCFQMLMQRGIGEPLEFWTSPFFYVGGAGTHYPHKDRDGSPIYPPNLQAPVRALGPMSFHRAEEPSPYTSVEEMIDDIGFTGEWFDCNDVEGYLLEKGIDLNNLSLFVPIPPAAVGWEHQASPSPTLHTTDSGTDSEGSAISMTVQSSSASTNSPSKLGSELSILNHSVYTPYYGLFKRHSLADKPYSTNPQSPSLATNLAPTASSRFPSFTLDIQRFVNELVHLSRCLGRAPGFRQCDVDTALRASVYAVY